MKGLRAKGTAVIATAIITSLVILSILAIGLDALHAANSTALNAQSALVFLSALGL